MKKLVSVLLIAALAVSLLAGCAAANSKALELTRGTVDGDTYTSEFTGITFTLPEGWMFATDEDLAALMDTTADMMSEEGEAMTAEMMKLKTIFDMMAQDPTVGNNVIVQIENLTASMSSNMTVDQYVEITVDGLEAYEEFTYVVGEASTKTVSGEEYTYMPFDETTYGFTQHFFVRKVDNYMVSLMVSLFDQTSLDDILTHFS